MRNMNMEMKFSFKTIRKMKHIKNGKYIGAFTTITGKIDDMGPFQV